MPSTLRSGPPPCRDGGLDRQPQHRLSRAAIRAPSSPMGLCARKRPRANERGAGGRSRVDGARTEHAVPAAAPRAAPSRRSVGLPSCTTQSLIVFHCTLFASLTGPLL